MGGYHAAASTIQIGKLIAAKTITPEVIMLDDKLVTEHHHKAIQGSDL
jgi:hypothetical protein